MDIVCNDCIVKDDCEAYEIIKRIQSLAGSILPDDVCNNIEKALETFEYCEYKE